MVGDSLIAERKLTWGGLAGLTVADSLAGFPAGHGKDDDVMWTALGQGHFYQRREGTRLRKKLTDKSTNEETLSSGPAFAEMSSSCSCRALKNVGCHGLARLNVA